MKILDKAKMKTKVKIKQRKKKKQNWKVRKRRKAYFLSKDQLFLFAMMFIVKD